MGIETPVIKYNLRKRGRLFTGQPRNFDVRAICDAINSPAMQENIALRTVMGYFGHGPRIRFGLDAAEGGIHNGKYIPVEPAFVTTYLKADYDGNVEHRAEFLDTESGKIAQKLFEGRVGGFSSAIDTNKPWFYGIDYVNSPNFAGNSFRGVAMDSANGMPAITYDEALAMEAEEREHANALITLLDNVQAERVQTIAVIERLQIENEQLLSALAKTGRTAASVLDAVPILPVAVAFDKAKQMERDSKLFLSADELPGFVAPEKEGVAAPQVSTVESRLLSRFIR